MPAFPLNKWHSVQLAVMDTRLTNLAKLVFARLMAHHNTKDGRCYPSEKALAVALDCSDRSIRSALKKLVENKYVRIKRHGGRNGTNQYDLAIPSGKKEYDQAAILRTNRRKPASAKQMKEPLKELERNRARKKFMAEKHLGSVYDEERIAKKKAQLQNAFVERFDNDEVGWNTLFTVDAKALGEIEKRFISGEIKLNTAVSKLLDVSNKQD